MDIVFEETLCEEVRRYPFLYNPSLKEYKDIHACNNAWRAISEAVGREEILCRNKWKYLRDRFVKAKKKLRGREPKSGNVPRMFALLSWLTDYVSHRDRERSLECQRSTRGRPNLSQPAAASAAPPTAALPHVTSASSAAPQSPVSTSSSVSTGEPRFSPTTSSRKRKSQSQSQSQSSSGVEDALLRLLQHSDKLKESQNQREEQRFGMMVADMLAKLPMAERMEAQFEIYQLLYLKQKKVIEREQSQSVKNDAQ